MTAIRTGRAGSRRPFYIEIWQTLDGLPLLLQPRVRVTAHRQVDVRVPCQGLGRLGVDAAVGEVREERVPQGVEVCVAPSVVQVGNIRRLQVRPYHLRCVRGRWHTKDSGRGQHASAVLTQ